MKSGGEDLEDDVQSNLATSVRETCIKEKSGWPLNMASAV